MIVCGILLFLGAAGIGLFAILHMLEVPKIERPQNVAWLAQNWTEEQRWRFYHLAQGSELLPRHHHLIVGCQQGAPVRESFKGPLC